MRPEIKTRKVSVEPGMPEREVHMVLLPQPIGLTTFSNLKMAQAFCTYISGMSDPAMINDLVDFHQTFGAPVMLSPCIPSLSRQELRKNLVHSESEEEFTEAWEKCKLCADRLAAAQRALDDAQTSSSLTMRRQAQALVDDWTTKCDESIAELADAIADSIYVLIGTALEYGLPLNAVWQQVQNSNMTKLWTQEELDSLEQSMCPHNDWSIAPALSAPLDGRRFVVKNAMGKVIKPPSWTAPDITTTIRVTRIMHQMRADKIMAVPQDTLEDFANVSPTREPKNPLAAAQLHLLEKQGVTFITEEVFYYQLGFRDSMDASGNPISAREAYNAWRRSIGDLTV